MELHPEVQSARTLTTQDRLYLTQTVNALPSSQLDELIDAVNQPKGILPSRKASKVNLGDAFLIWVESPAGCGLVNFETSLMRIVSFATKTAKQFLAFMISSRNSHITQAQLQEVIHLLRRKAEDDSINFLFFELGSFRKDLIKLVLRGSEAGLGRLQNLFDSRELADLGIPHIESVQPIHPRTTSARKARFVEVLRFRCPLVQILHRAHRLARVLTRARDIELELSHNLNLARNLDLTTAIDLANAHALAGAIDLDIIHARARAGAISRAIYFVHEPLINLSQIDLSGTNLEDIYLVGIDLVDTNLSQAIVESAIFGDNPGLGDAEKDDLEARGAIFQNAPGTSGIEGYSHRPQ